jgi:membrane-associated phospholipid phosphatase
MKSVETIDRIGSPKVVLPLAMATAFLARRRRGSGRLALAVSLAIFTEEALKRVVSRRRPRVHFFGRRRSFPSGHSAGSSTYLAALALMAPPGAARWASLAATGAAVGAINVMRVREREHWVSDVVVGDVIGALALGGAHLAIERRASHVRLPPGLGDSASRPRYRS